MMRALAIGLLVAVAASSTTVRTTAELREVLDSAVSGVYEIALPAGSHFNLNGSALSVAAGVALTLRALPGGPAPTIDAMYRTPIFMVQSRGRLSVHGVRLQHGRSQCFYVGHGVGRLVVCTGGCVTVRDHGYVELRDSILWRCVATNHYGGDALGGGLYVGNGNVTLVGGEISGCSAFATGHNASGFGGAVAVLGGSLTLTNTRVRDCATFSGSGANANAFGGGLYSQQADVTLVESTISGCSANAVGGGGAVGGAVFSNGGRLTLTKTSVHDSYVVNSGSGGVRYAYGGGVSSMSADVTLMDSRISGCFANTTGDGRANGGAVFSFLGNLTLTNVSVHDSRAFASGSGYEANAHGGGVYSLSSTATLVDSTISGCSAITTGDSGAMGGGVYSDNSRLSMTNTSVRDSSAFASGSGGLAHAEGGGVHNSVGSATLIASSLDFSTKPNRSGYKARNVSFVSVVRLIF